VAEAGVTCRECGGGVALLWTFCPQCGAPVEPRPTSPLPAEADPVTLQALRLLREGRAREAEELLAGAGASAEARLLYARLLIERSDFAAARAHLDEALRLSPGSYVVRVRRCEYFARLGLYPEALDEVAVARRVAPDVASLLHAQDLERRLREMSRHSFARTAALPALPSWRRLRGVFARKRRTGATP
jgi:tetratricopeptide (TPR) repeat protein